MVFMAIAAASIASIGSPSLTCDLGALFPVNGGYPVSRIDVIVDPSAHTANGYLAQITDTEIRWEQPVNAAASSGKPSSMSTEIDRRSGAIRIGISGSVTIMAGRCFAANAGSTAAAPASVSSSPRKPIVALVCHLNIAQGDQAGQPLGDRTFTLDEEQGKVDGLPATFAPYEIRFSFESGTPGKPTSTFNVIINRSTGAVVLLVDGLGVLSQGRCERAGTPQF